MTTTPLHPPRRQIVILGAGGIGLAIARRLTHGRHLHLADFSPAALSSASDLLTSCGYSFTTHQVDISSYPSVLAFANTLAAASSSSSGPQTPLPLPLQIDAIVLAAGISPIQASHSLSRLLSVDLLGTANVLEAFWQVEGCVSPGTSFVCMASAAAHLYPWPSADLQKHLALAPLDRLLDHPELKALEKKTTTKNGKGEEEGGGEGGAGGFAAYGLAKQGNILRVKACAKKWGERGARVNSVSPGVVTTGMSKEENESESAGPKVRELVGMSAFGREGTADDVAAMVAFLTTGGESGFITGADFLVDGGSCSSVALMGWKKAEEEEKEGNGGRGSGEVR